jgi:hypothetical protein
VVRQLPMLQRVGRSTWGLCWRRRVVEAQGETVPVAHAAGVA